MKRCRWRRVEKLQAAKANVASSIAVGQQPSAVAICSIRVLNCCSSLKNTVVAKVSRWSVLFERKLGADAHQLEITIEVLLQTFQAYKMSSLVANCWFVLLMHVVLCKKPSAQVKILMLIFDSRMDAVYAIAVPFAIFYPYYAQYNPKLQAIPASTRAWASGRSTPRQVCASSSSRRGSTSSRDVARLCFTVQTRHGSITVR